MSVLLALSAAMSWGTADFLGGLASRRHANVNAVALGTQFTGLVVFIPIAFVVNGSLTVADFWWALGGGMSVGTGIYLLYLGFSKSHTGVVAPIAAIGTASIPALFGVATGERLALWQIVGVLLGLIAVWLISRSGPERLISRSGPELGTYAANTRIGVIYGTVAGLGFAVMFIAIDQLSAGSGAWGVLPMRFGGVLILATISLVRGVPLVAEKPVWLLILVSGFVGSLGNLAFIVATRLGNLSVVAVVSSLFPAATVALAYVIVRERLNRVQLIGVVAALTAVALVSSG